MTTPNQSFTFNAYQSNLAGPLLAGLTTVALDFIPSGLGVPAYLVIDPDVPASREYIKVLAYTGNTIDSMERNLEGSAGDVDHLVGAVIRAVYTMQALDDTFLDIEGNTTAQDAHASDVGDPHALAGYAKSIELQTHIDDAGDPHAAASYLKLSETDALYLRLDGASPMAAAIDMANFNINQLATPIVDDDAATKKYVDDQDGLFLPITGGEMTGTLDIGSDASITAVVWSTNRLVSAIAYKMRGFITNLSGVLGYGRIEHQSAGVVDALVLMGEGNILMTGTTGAFRLGMERVGVSYQWRFAIGGTGDLLLQSSPDGTAWTTQETWTGTP